MGDHRATIKIDFDFHGKVYKYDGWINWSPEDNGIDQRIVDFFEESARDGYARYNAEIYEYHREERERQEKVRELAELARLKKKYPQDP